MFLWHYRTVKSFIQTGRWKEMVTQEDCLVCIRFLTWTISIHAGRSVRTTDLGLLTYGTLLPSTVPLVASFALRCRLVRVTPCTLVSSCTLVRVTPSFQSKKNRKLLRGMSNCSEWCATTLSVPEVIAVTSSHHHNYFRVKLPVTQDNITPKNATDRGKDMGCG